MMYVASQLVGVKKKRTFLLVISFVVRFVKKGTILNQMFHNIGKRNFQLKHS